MKENIETDLLKEGKYLKHEILAFSGNWLIVFDKPYNYVLFNYMEEHSVKQYKKNRMPLKVEYYSTFDNALDNLVKKIGAEIIQKHL